MGFAERELADRRAAGFPPAAKLVVVEGSRQAVDAFDSVAAAVPQVERFGPLALDEEHWRLSLRTTPARASDLLSALRAEAGRRSSAKESAVRITVDPQEID